MKAMLLILLLASPVFGQYRCPPGTRPVIVEWPINPQTCRPARPMVPVAPVTPSPYVPSEPPVMIEDLPLPNGNTEEPNEPEQPQTDPCKELALIVAELAASVQQTTTNINNLTAKVEGLVTDVADLKQQLAVINVDITTGAFKGDKGDKGDRGEQGPQGLQGLPGPAANFEQLPIYMEKVYMEKEGVDSQGRTIWKEGTATREVIPPGGGFRLRLFPPD